MKTLRKSAEQAAAALRQAFPELGSPAAFLQVGTGFDLAGLLDREYGRIPLSRLPDMPDAPSPAGHPLELVCGDCAGARVLIALGHRHVYEGHGVRAAVLPVCAAALCGTRNILLFGRADSLRPDLKPGTLVMLIDYINSMGASPLLGNADLGNEAFPDLREAYAQELIAALINAADEVGLSSRLGVYQANLGPQFPTPGEAEVARRNGADLTGFSLVPETIAARAMGCRVAAVALVTNLAPSPGTRPVTFADCSNEAGLASPDIVRALRVFFAEYGSNTIVAPRYPPRPPPEKSAP